MTKMAISSSMPSPLSDDWNASASPWKCVVNGGGQHAARGLLHAGHGFAQADAGLQVERHRHAGSWPAWLTLSGPTPRLDVGDAAQRHQVARRSSARTACQGRGLVLDARVELQDHLVGVVGGVDGARSAACRRRCRARLPPAAPSGPSEAARSRSIFTSSSGFLIWRSVVTSRTPRDLRHLVGEHRRKVDRAPADRCSAATAGTGSCVR